MKLCKEEKTRKDKSDRNTKDKVLDQKTIMILQKLLARNKLTDLQGSICTGKEANVYAAVASTELYSKYVKNIHTLNESENKNVFSTKKLQETLKTACVNETKSLIKDVFVKAKSKISLSKKKIRKISKLRGNIENFTAIVGNNVDNVTRSTQGFLANKTSTNKISEDLSENECSANKITESINDTLINQNVNSLTANKKEEMIKVAIKIYKTSAMNFKDRERYLEGEKRFKNFCTHNSRKLIRLWAEKEVRNLKRINKSGIPSPVPIYLKRNVLIMSLIGDPAVKLKDAFIEDKSDCYKQVIQIIDDMYNKCNLIHADLSEYNLLYHNNIVYVIDVGQSVEKDHVNAFEFLISDIYNVNNFFKKIGVEKIGINDLFIKITRVEIPEYLKDWDIKKNTFIPNSLNDIANIEDIGMFTNNLEEVVHNEYNPVIKKEEEIYELSRKERKKLVKEFNKERRVYKISKVEKNRIFKKYIGKKKK